MHKIRLICGFVVGLVLIHASLLAQQESDDISAFHHQILTLDSHVDTPLRLGRSAFDIGILNDSRKGGGKMDFPRMKEGGLDAVFFAVFIGQGERDEASNLKAKEKALRIFDDIDLALNNYPEMASLALTAEDAERINKQGKLAIFIGVENGYPIGKDIGMVQTLYDRGARYITLSHSYNNDICDSSTDDEGPEHNGLSPFGVEVVQEMNRLGMMVDVSHISDSAFYEVVALSTQPVIASHSNARAICDHPRNLTDDMLLKLKEHGGVVQLCVLSSYVKNLPENPLRDSAFRALRERYNGFKNLDEEQMQKARQAWYALDEQYPAELASVADLVDHVDHIVELIGIDHVGIGTDFDGGGALSDCFDVTELENITRELLNRGYSKQDIQKIWSGNFLRVFTQVERGRES
ncbi:MAG: dipeptidase [Bacteroidetes bacterium]|nr:dipeptidase [Bacteroidota bacterium]MBU1579900.1 dipeptidase [Bacteroidota bacterium]MBU2557778.1 dipeptidase [Bacteroidota bacterium]